MEPRKTLMLSALPGVALAIMLVLAVPGSALVQQPDFSESLPVHGYVTVSVVRDGNEIYRHEDHNLITTAGIDFIAAQMGGAGGTATAQYIGLSTNAAAPAAGDTTLAGEITTNGLQRAQGTYAHTAGTGTFTITETFTAGGSFTDVRKAGLFNASSGGTMVAENTFTPVSLANGDQLTITWSVTLSSGS